MVRAISTESQNAKHQSSSKIHEYQVSSVLFIYLVRDRERNMKLFL